MLAAALALGLANAQTSTDCNPLEKTCPSDNALGKTITVDFTKGASDDFTVATGTTLQYGSNGAEFVITSETQAPTIESTWYIFFGRVSVTTQAATGTGIVSSFVLESDDLDEIDWEWLGGDTTEVQSNYFGKGNTTSYDRGGFHTVSTPQTTFHTYTVDWTAERIEWIIDDVTVRTLLYADAVGGKNYPQTPMRVKIGSWVGGSSTAAAGTVQWAGGLSTFPGTYTMYVKSLTIEDYTTSGSTYTYSDTTGSYESITISGAAGGIDSTNTTSSSESSVGGSSSSASKSATGVFVASTTLATSALSSASTTVEHIGNAPTGTAVGSTAPTFGNTTKAAAAATGTTAAGTGASSTASSSSSSSSAAVVSVNAAGGLSASIPVVLAVASFSYLLL